MKETSTARTLVKYLLLKPLSLAYGVITSVRNRCFDWGVLQQRKFDIPVIVVGNIAVGGTGKTPHTEYLVELLRTRYNIAVLSRGYNRRTKGFRLATAESTAQQIGDEPYQIFCKFGDKGVTVAVDEDRCHGIDRLREHRPDLNLIILDDAFQHRYVKPTVSVVLTEHSRPVFEDEMLPSGRLRENKDYALHRADIVVVTKCPDEMKQIDYRIFTKNMGLEPWQKLFFSKYVYEDLTPLFPEDAPASVSLERLTDKNTIVAVAGIANPKPFVKHLRTSAAKIRGLIFDDHHNFTVSDINAVMHKIKTSPEPANTIVVTTEKDAMRLREFPGLPKALRRRIFYIPVTVRFVNDISDSSLSGGREFVDYLVKMITADGQH